MAVVYGQSYTFSDSKGQVSTERMFIGAADDATAATDAHDILTALQALTNATLYNAKGAYNTAPGPHTYGTTAEYETIEDKAMMVFQTDTGAIHRYLVPAPKSAIFLTDKETVDPTNGLVTTYVTAMLAAAVSRDGTAMNAFIGGVRLRKKLQRRFNIFTKNPALSGPGE